MKAVLKGRVSCADALLGFEGTHINVKDATGETALLKACAKGNLEMVERLLGCQSGVDVDPEDVNGVTPLMKAAARGFDLVVSALLSYGCDAKKRSNQGETAFMKACLWGHEACVKVLLGAGADLEERDGLGETAFVKAAKEGHCDVVDLLLKKNADFNSTNNLGQTALMKAVPFNDGQTSMVASDGEDHTDTDGALVSAIQRIENSVVVVEKLLACHGIQVNAQDGLGRTALMKAAQIGVNAIVDLLLSHPDTDARVCDLQGQNSLMKAASWGNVGCVARLLVAGVPVNVEDINGETALVEAAGRGNEACVRVLLDVPDIDVICRNRWGETPLLKAASKPEEITRRVKDSELGSDHLI
ncbi:ankyrin [Coprinopsis marcescibilis]|uniref:Ankyrin n=1 Tax=Coprinopsis marcescibilis TaxID=230819 RepID=A0A5C3KDY1_COPMA|nr:ankyrin [Coprinopsis marcescibilis]